MHVYVYFGGIYYVHVYMYMLLLLQNPLLWAVTLA